MKRQAVFVLAAVISASCADPGFGALPQYEIVDLGVIFSIKDEIWVQAHAINNSGQVAGVAQDVTGMFNPKYPVLWDSTDGLTNLGTLGGNRGAAWAINNSGQIAGDSMTTSGNQHGFFWSRATGLIDLGTLGGDGSQVSAINDSGQVVGCAMVASGSKHAFLWENNAMIDLGTLGGWHSWANGINNLGQVVGYSWMPNSDRHAFIWDRNNGMIDLGTIEGYIRSEAYAINNTGQVVGILSSFDDELNRTYQAFIWNNIDGMVELGEPSNEYEYFIKPECINDLGQVIGSALSISLEGYTFYWDSTNGMIQFEDLLPADSDWEFFAPYNINNQGQILGIGPCSDFEKHVLMMVPVPAPVIEATIDINPDTLNLSSKGKWITCLIWLDRDYDVADVNSNSVFLEDEIEASYIWFDEEDQVVMAKFNRSEIQEILRVGDVELAVSGNLTDGTKFVGTDTIRVIDQRGIKNRKAKP